MKILRIVPTMALTLCASVGIARAGTIVADFQADYQAGTPKSGWSYLWNSTGPIGVPANYAPLKWDATHGFYDGNGSTYPLPYSVNDPYTKVDATGGHPGEGYLQSSDGIQHYVIVSYTLATSGMTSIVDFTGQSADPNSSTDGVNFFVGVNTGGAVIASVANGGSYDSADIALGSLSAGDTIYVGIGSGATDYSDSTSLEFRISQDLLAAPLPTSALAGLALLAGLGATTAIRRRASSNGRGTGAPSRRIV